MWNLNPETMKTLKNSIQDEIAASKSYEECV